MTLLPTGWTDGWRPASDGLLEFWMMQERGIWNQAWNPVVTVWFWTQ